MLRDTLFFASIFFFAIGVITLFLPVELYDGVALMENGTLEPEKLSLSYLLDKPQFLAQYEDYGVVDIQLNSVGWILVGIVNFGIPLLLGYRVAIARHKKRSLK